MSSKPAYQGTYEQYNKLPREVKQYYAPPVETPAGYEFESAKTVYPKQVYGTTYGTQTKPNPTPPFEEVTFKPKPVDTKYIGSPPGFFGVTSGVVDVDGELVPVTNKFLELSPEKQREVLEPVKVQIQMEKAAGVKGPSSMEARALTGLSLASTGALVVNVPVAAAGAGLALGVAEPVKLAVSGKHLTPEEAIGVASVGAVAGVGLMSGAKALQPRAQKGIDASYRQAVEQGEVWKPSVIQKLSMKVTGARAPRLAQEIVGAGEPRGITLSMLQKGQTVGSEESYFWDMPTPKSAQAYVRGYPSSKSWVDTTLVKRAYLEGLFVTTFPQRLLLENPSKLEPKMPYIPKEPPIVSESSYPLTAPLLLLPLSTSLSAPSRTVTVQRQMQRQGLIESSMQSEMVSEVLGTSQVQRQGQRQASVQVQKQTQVLDTVLETKQAAVTAPPFIPQKTVNAPRWVTSGFDFPRGFGRLNSKIFGKYGRYRREYPIKTASQMLKDVLK